MINRSEGLDGFDEQPSAPRGPVRLTVEGSATGCNACSRPFHNPTRLPLTYL